MASALQSLATAPASASGSPKPAGPDAREETPSSGGAFARLMRSDDKPPAKPDARPDPKPASPAEETGAAPNPVRNQATTKDEEISADPADRPAPDQDWPPLGLGIFPALLLTPTAMGATPAPAPSGAGPGASGLANAAPLPAASIGTAAQIDPQQALLQAAVASQNASVPAPTNAASASAPASGTAAQANANAQTAAGAAPAPATALPLAAPDIAFELPKEWSDALRRQGDADASAPTANTLQSPTIGSSFGLARTAVVNAMEAPTADLHGENFDEAVGSRLTWMAEQKIGHAHIRINPQELGPVEIRMRLDGERVHADFSSPQAEVRQALENSLPKLRDMLAQHGFALAQANVGQHGQPGQPGRQDPQSPDGGSTAPQAAAAADADGQPAQAVRSVRGLLDAYA